MGFELVDVLDAEHPSRVRLVFSSYPFLGDLAASPEQLRARLFTTLTYEDTMERPT